MAEKSSRLFGIQCRLDCPSPVLLEDLTTGAHLLRIAQEALNNAVRHGHATEVTITLESEPHQLTLSVQDNGIGLPPVPADSDGMGIHIMHYRSRMIGATLQIDSMPGNGTTVRCTLRQCGKHLRELVENISSVTNGHAT
jgi:two-component system CheB/CheR fusion protein